MHTVRTHAWSVAAIATAIAGTAYGWAKSAQRQAAMADRMPPLAVTR